MFSSQAHSLSHGGILFPLEMFRPSALAQLIGEYFVSKARNVLDAKLQLSHETKTHLVMLRITGSVVGDNEGEFWKDHSDLVLLLSRAFPMQTFLYYAMPTPNRREGLVVAQGGQALMADEIAQDMLPEGAGDEAWPLPRLCEQMGISVDKLAEGFADGPRIEFSLLEPNVSEDEALLTYLVRGDAEEVPPPGPAKVTAAQDFAGPTASPPAQTARPPAAAAGAQSASSSARPGSAASGRVDPRAALAQDERRRAQERNEEKLAREELAASARSGLRYVQDEQGVVVAPKATLEDVDVLTPFVKRRLEGDVPEGVPRELTAQLQGKNIDFVVPVEFLSEVFVQANPLSKGHFEAQAQALHLADVPVQALEVQAPRLGSGTLIAQGKTRVFISRSPNDLPQAFVAQVLAESK